MTGAKREAIYWLHNGKCGYCGKKLKRSWRHVYSQSAFTIDHIVPKSKGGTSAYENLMPCCRKCNFLKGNKSLKEFRKILNTDFYFERRHKNENGQRDVNKTATKITKAE